MVYHRGRDIRAYSSAEDQERRQVLTCFRRQWEAMTGTSERAIGKKDLTATLFKLLLTPFFQFSLGPLEYVAVFPVDSSTGPNTVAVSTLK